MRRPTARSGFTLAEVAVTLLIVSVGLVLIIQGMTGAKLSAADTHHRKLARELALLTLGQVESGLFWEDLDSGDRGDVLTGTYAEEGYEDFHYELVLGDEDFSQPAGGRDDDAYHDSWEYERERQDRIHDRDDDDVDEQDAHEPFEKVRIKVTYPQIGERKNTLVLERWMDWEQVYGTSDGDKEQEAVSDS